jgi:hypothetical protein
MILRPRHLAAAGLALAVAASLFFVRSGESLPLFARQQHVPCTTCHMAFPRLNAFGMAFKQNGYRMPGQPGKSPWDSENFPLSLIGNVGANWMRTDADTGGGNRATMTTSNFQQNWVEFHTAGTLAPKVTFHFDNGFATETGVLESGLAFVQFDDVVGNDGRLNVKAGIFDGEIPYISDARRTTMAGYLTDWTQDNRGIELNGTHSNWMYAAGVVNSDRTQGKAGSTNLNQLENVYGWLTREIGTSMVTARVRLERQDPRVADKNASMHRQVDLSAYVCPTSYRFAVIPAVTLEHYDDQAQAKDVNTGMVEAIALLDKDSKWVATGRVEVQNVPAAGGLESSNTTQTAFNLAYYVNPNARVALDWTHLSDNVQGPKIDQVQAFVHVGY